MDSGFGIPVSCFRLRVPDSGFRILGLPKIFETVAPLGGATARKNFAKRPEWLKNRHKRKVRDTFEVGKLSLKLHNFF